MALNAQQLKEKIKETNDKVKKIMNRPAPPPPKEEKKEEKKPEKAAEAKGDKMEEESKPAESGSNKMDVE